MKTAFFRLFFFGFFFLGWALNALAAEIHFSADKTEGTTDDIFQVRLSVDGEVDGGQVGIEGLEHFAIVGQQSSSQVHIINGKTSMVQEQILSLQPKSAGDFSLRALAQEDGKVIKSSPILVKVKKSLIAETKEKLLQVPTQNEGNNQKAGIAKKEKEDLLRSPSLSGGHGEKAEELSLPELQSFPKVQHLSAFNAIFWGEFFGILGLLLLIVAAGYIGVRHMKKRK